MAINLPKYVDYGGLTTVPAPFQSLGTTLYGFILEGDLEKMRAFCKQVFYDPSNGDVEYVPISRFMLMSVGNIQKIIPAAPYDKIGYSAEGQVAFWMFTAAVKRIGNIRIAERLAVFVPYIFVHNAFSFACGREVEGYPKSWGWFDFPPAANKKTPPPPLDNFKLDVWGLKKYDPSQETKRTPLLEIKRGKPSPGEKKSSAWNTLEDALADMKDLIFDADHTGTITLPGIQLAENLFDDLKNHELPEVFLKQYRDVRDATDACYQAIIELPNKVHKFSGFPLFDTYNIKFKDVSSHPLGEQLGLKNQQAALSFWLKMDFTVQDGRIVWQARTEESTNWLARLWKKLFG